MKRIINLKHVLLIISIITLSVTAILPAHTNGIKFIASMSGDHASPPSVSSINGTASFRTTEHDTMIKYKVKVSGSSDVTSADIHLDENGQSGESVVDLLKDSKKNGIWQGTSIRGNITSSDLKGSLEGKALTDLITAMKNGTAFVNIDTPFHQNGEIRGQIINHDSNNSTKVN